MKLLNPVLSVFLIPLLTVLPLQAQLPAPDPAGPALHLLFKSQTTAQVNSQTDAGLLVEVTDAKGSPVPDAAVAFRLPDFGATGTFTDGSHAAVAYTDAAGQAHSPAIHWGVSAGSASLRITAVKGGLHAGLMLEETLQPAAHAPTPGALPISAPQVVVIPVRPPSVASPLVVDPPTPNGAPLNYAAPASAALKPLPETKSGASPAPVPKPVVSITTAPDTTRHSNKKWLILALIGVGAGVGAAMAMKGKTTTTPSAPAAVAPPIGTPTVSVGH